LTSRPTIASSSPTGNSSTSAPSRRIVPTSITGGGTASARLVSRSQLASGLIVAPWISAEVITTKKTRLKNSSAFGTPSITGKVAKTTGRAPRSPAQLTSVISRTE
jgi:hypothetical protein